MNGLGRRGIPSAFIWHICVYRCSLTVADIAEEKESERELTKEEMESGVEMQNDFDGTMHDMPDDVDEDKDDEDEEDDGEELDREMGDAGDQADVIDEKIWGDVSTHACCCPSRADDS